MANLLELNNVSKVYTRGLINAHATVALQNFSLELKEDEPTILTVAGESGSGKTTLAMLLLGFITATTGEIIYRGKNIVSLHGEERLAYRREVQAVFQDPFAVFNPFYTVDHLLTVPIKRFKLARTKAEARKKMDESLTAVGLRPEDVLGRFPHQLSGGQRQRINVARALLLKPRLLIATSRCRWWTPRCAPTFWRRCATCSATMACRSSTSRTTSPRPITSPSRSSCSTAVA